jgi:hypothetical protein
MDLRNWIFSCGQAAILPQTDEERENLAAMRDSGYFQYT